MKVLLLSNYQPDKQQSMLRFTEMLDSGLRDLGHQTAVVRPEPCFGKISSGSRGMGKWFGYLDKFVCFPRSLKRAAKWADVVHICDHSNAFYTQHLNGAPSVVTCHDLLAVRGAFGQETDCPASVTGKILQRWIVAGLERAKMIVCNSSFTRKDLESIIPPDKKPRTELVLLGLNHTFRVIGMEECLARFSRFPALDTSRPFVLHVGSSLKRKNREGIIRIFNLTKDHWDAQLVFAGAPLEPHQQMLVQECGLQSRVLHVEPDNDLLEALYNRAVALLFPSRFEGFGWPIIEAQACGCPVLCSDRCSLPEVAGDAGIVLDLDDERGFAEWLLKMVDPQEREMWAKRGLANLRRFSAKEMILEYVRLYQDLLNTCHS